MRQVARGAMILMLALAGCTPPDMEYVLTPSVTGRTTSRIQFKADSTTRRVTMRMRAFKGDSLVESFVGTMGEGDNSKCTMFGATSWTCTENGGEWTFDSDELRYKSNDGVENLIYHPRAVRMR